MHREEPLSDRTMTEMILPARPTIVITAPTFRVSPATAPSALEVLILARNVTAAGAAKFAATAYEFPAWLGAAIATGSGGEDEAQEG
ncbi:hypothetical protein E4U43_004002 [Claviceps pusilla]|uniref:Uncharacterized protein n=1 Tax=Claviceps pusilla TaxID=123648 RepID=A0A9P7N3Y6_9HYPO|nr:hypothetical protein E4U43_004002 [Claviceps pusilla]